MEINLSRRVFDDKVEALLLNFDFYKVNKVMKSLNWEWVGIKRVPEVVDLIKEVKENLEQFYLCLKDNTREESIRKSGGFKYHLIKDDYYKDGYCFFVEFIVEREDSYFS